jgi:predicted SprT family Zn-dependent metalloprotease
VTDRMPEWAKLVRPWAALWGLPGIEDALQVRFDARLRRSLGRCQPHEGRISLNPSLGSAPRRSLAHVLCHEAAHVAAYVLHGERVRPHGAEWSALVSAAGYAPIRRATASTFGVSIPEPSRRRQNDSGYAASRTTRLTVVHRCPVCQTVRLARRPVRAWRCAECVAAGLEGRLVITRAMERAR